MVAKPAFRILRLRFVTLLAGLILLAAASMDAQGINKEHNYQNYKKIAIFSDTETMAVQAHSFTEFLKGFLEALENAGYNLNREILLKTYLFAPADHILRDQFGLEIKGKIFDLVICVGKQHAAFLADQGIPLKKIIEIDESSLQLSNNYRRRWHQVTTSLSSANAFESIHHFLPHLNRVLVVTTSDSLFAEQVLTELELKRSAQQIREIIPVAIDKNIRVKDLCDQAESGRSFIYVAGDMPPDERVVELITDANELCIPIVTHSGTLIESEALLSIGIDLTQLGREVGEAACEIIQGIKIKRCMAFLPESVRICVNSQTLRKLNEKTANRTSPESDSNVFPGILNIQPVNWSVQISEGSQRFAGKHLAVEDRYVKFENETWQVRGSEIPLKELIGELNDVLHLSGQTGRIMVSGEEDCTVSITTSSKSLKNILDMVMYRVGGLCNQNTMDEYLCKMPETGNNSELTTWIYRPKGAQLNDLRERVVNWDKDVLIETDDQANILIFSGPFKSLLSIRDYLTGVDIIPPEVMIELLVVEFIHGKSFSWGIDLSNGQKNGVSNLTFSPGEINPVKLTFNILDSLNISFNANIRALSESNEARIITNPHLATKNGQAATISSKEQRYMTLESYDYESNRTSHMLQELNAGVELNITPRIMAGNLIDLKLEGKLSVFEIPSNETNAEHVVNATNISSSISVKDGATLVIGGIIKTEVNKAKHKVPVLGSIPLIGLLFTKTFNEKNIIETAIYITPHIYPVNDYKSITSWGQIERIMHEIKQDIYKSIRVMERIN